MPTHMTSAVAGGQTRRARGLFSLTHPNKELFRRQRSLLQGTVPSGATVANGHAHRGINVNEHLIRYHDSTFFMRVAGDSMCGLGIFDGDLLVVDRTLPATHGCVVIAVLDGEFTVKQYLHGASGQILRAAHPAYPDTVVRPDQDFSVWGVVSWSGRRLQSDSSPVKP
jgi:DNA polymerase V